MKTNGPGGALLSIVLVEDGCGGLFDAPGVGRGGEGTKRRCDHLLLLLNDALAGGVFVCCHGCCIVESVCGRFASWRFSLVGDEVACVGHAPPDTRGYVGGRQKYEIYFGGLTTDLVFMWSDVTQPAGHKRLPSLFKG